jgi:hypothetical protein
VANHRRRQAEKEAAIRRQQQAEAHRQRYFAALAAELEQRRQEELLAARRAEFIHSQQARARLVAAERQRALQVYLQQLKGAEHVCLVLMLVVDVILIDSSPQIARQPHVVKRRPLADALKQRLAAESDVDISEPIRNILSSLEPRPAQSEKSEDSSEGAAKLIEDLLSSIFPGLAFHTQPQPAPPDRESRNPASQTKERARPVLWMLRNSGSPRQGPSLLVILSPTLSGTLWNSRSLPPLLDLPTKPVRPDYRLHLPLPPHQLSPKGNSLRSTAQLPSPPSSISIAPSLRLQNDFVLPTELDHYTPSADDRDETASVSSTSSSDLTKLIPYTTNNKPVYKYENELNGLLVELDRIDSHGDAEVREKRKEVVKAIEKALGGVEHAVGEAVEKRLSLISATIPTTDETLKGFDADEDVTEEAAPTLEQVDAPVVVDGVAVPESSTSIQSEETVVGITKVSPPVDEALPESYKITDPSIEPASTGSDVEASTATITPASVELASVTVTESTIPQVQADAPETTDTLLLPESVSPLPRSTSLKRSTAIVTRRPLCSIATLRRATGLKSSTRLEIRWALTMSIICLPSISIFYGLVI